MASGDEKRRLEEALRREAEAKKRAREEHAKRERALLAESKAKRETQLKKRGW